MPDSAINANKGQSKHFLLLSKHNESFERNGLLEKNILDQLLYVWMFEVDAVNDPLLEECGGLNTMHLLGILVCRALYKEFCSKEEKIKNARSQLAIHDYLPDSEQVVHVVCVGRKHLFVNKLMNVCRCMYTKSLCTCILFVNSSTRCKLYNCIFKKFWTAKGHHWYFFTH